MTEHHGLIELGDNDVEVVITFNDSRLRLASNGDEIGDWDRSMYSLNAGSAGTFVLRAENDALTFKPDSPEEFAVAASRDQISLATPGLSPEVVTGPPPKLVTMILFYLLATVTLALGVWAAISLMTVSQGGVEPTLYPVEEILRHIM